MGPEQQRIYWICLALIGSIAPFSLWTLWGGVDAPYGRYKEACLKQHNTLALRLMATFDIHPKVAWCLMESPPLFMAAACWATASSECSASLGNRIVLLCFAIHYVNRACIYPLRMRGAKPVSLFVFISATGFCAANGYVQSRSLTQFLVISGVDWTTLLGVSLWALGFYINTDADSILRNLRKPGETGYKTPHGGMFEFVSGANFFGEILEWAGYVVAMRSALPALAFWICTTINIGPRAFGHHKWYLKKINDYPKYRKALIPFVL